MIECPPEPMSFADAVKAFGPSIAGDFRKNFALHDMVNNRLIYIVRVGEDHYRVRMWTADAPEGVREPRNQALDVIARFSRTPAELAQLRADLEDALPEIANAFA